MYDVLIIGDGLAGPAALAHAIERGLAALLICSSGGGAIAKKPLCCPDGTMTIEHHAVGILKRWIADHADRVVTDHIIALARHSDGFQASSARTSYLARTLILTTGAPLAEQANDTPPPGLFLADALGGPASDQSLIAIGRGTLAALRAYDYIVAQRQRGGLAARKIG